MAFFKSKLSEKPLKGESLMQFEERKKKIEAFKERQSKRRTISEMIGGRGKEGSQQGYVKRIKKAKPQRSFGVRRVKKESLRAFGGAGSLWDPLGETFGGGIIGDIRKPKPKGFLKKKKGKRMIRKRPPRGDSFDSGMGVPDLMDIGI